MQGRGVVADFIHVDFVQQDPDVPEPPGDACEREDCPGKTKDQKGWEVGYGLAGGGMGVYTYCNPCGRVVDKVQDRNIEEEKPE